MSLYLKYRPQTFKDVTGQEAVITTLSHALRTQSLTHAYLFGGSRGTGKTSLARIIAKAINCMDLKDGYEPCNACNACTGIREGKWVDLIEIDAASNRGIDEIRDLKEKILFAPTQGRAKVYIIDEVHMLTKEAFNALLKTLEEPPAHAYFILATTEVHKIPETILSRCQQFSFRRISQEDIEKRLSTIVTGEGWTADSEALKQIAFQAHGGLRDAIGLLEQLSLEKKVTLEHVKTSLGLSSQSLLNEFVEALEKKETGKGITLIGEIAKSGINLGQFTTECVGLLRQKLLQDMKEPEKAGEWMRLIEIFLSARQQLVSSLIPELPLEMAVLKACHFEVKPPTAEKKIFKKEETLIEKEPVGEALMLSLPHIRKEWNQVMERIETPFIRTSLKDAEPIAYENGKLSIVFKSSSMMEKIQNPHNQSAVLKALEEVFSSKMHLKIELKKITLPNSATMAPETKPSTVDMAKEVFGV